MTPEALQRWQSMRGPESRWRQESRAVMIRIVRELRDAGRLGDDAALVKAVDDAYPFGERAMHPYKCWLGERRILLQILFDQEAPAPTADEVGVCEVAGDLVQLGRLEEASKLLEEQAPNRLARKCPACGARAGDPCRHADATAPGTKYAYAANRPAGWPRCVHCGRHISDHHGKNRICNPGLSRELIVPHHARLVGHRDPGPLFHTDKETP